jgi:hypothetical protein
MTHEADPLRTAHEIADDLQRWADNAAKGELVKLSPSHCRGIADRIRAALASTPQEPVAHIACWAPSRTCTQAALCHGVCAETPKIAPQSAPEPAQGNFQDGLVTLNNGTTVSADPVIAFVIRLLGAEIAEDPDQRYPGSRLLRAVGDLKHGVLHGRFPNPSRQIREDNQGLGEPGRLSPPTPQAQPVALPGFVLVPVEPTLPMLVAGSKASLDVSVLMDDSSHSCERACYAAMLAAAPQPPTPGEPK